MAEIAAANLFGVARSAQLISVKIKTEGYSSVQTSFLAAAFDAMIAAHQQDLADLGELVFRGSVWLMYVIKTDKPPLGTAIFQS